MTIINTQLLDNTPANIDKAAEIIKAGGVVAVPTETVYGLAADASNKEAVNAIFAAKGRPNNHPLIIHIHSLSQLQQLAINIPTQCYLLAEAFWPGPLTMLLEKSAQVLDVVTGELPTVGIRMPNHPVLQALLAQGDLYVAAPSANPHKRLSPTTANQVFKELYGKIDAVIDGGACAVGMESTIIDLTQVGLGHSAKILRAGPILRQQLSDVLGQPVLGYELHDHQVPGNIEQHYQPSAKLSVMNTHDLIVSMQNWPSNSACLWFSDKIEQILGSNIVNEQLHRQFKQIPASKALYAHAFYSALYELDQNGFSTIFVEKPPTHEDWADINDRLNRASA